MPAKTETKSETRINGVPVNTIVESIEALKTEPRLGESHFRATNRWIDGANNRTKIQGFFALGGEDTSRKEPFVFDNDEPPALGGENRGANPVEFVLHGLAGCITTTLVYYAAAQGIELEEVESSLEGDIDLRGLLGVAPVNPGYQGIRINVRVKSNAPEKKIRELIHLAQSRSPVVNTVAKPVPITVTLEKQ